MPKEAENLIGQIFHRLTVISRTKGPCRGTFWNCVCICGGRTVTSSPKLKSGHTKSCGCLAIEHAIKNGKASTTHGQTKTALYGIWRSMIERCENPNAVSFKYYGQKGIKVCDRWRHSFELFSQDMGPRPSSGHTIDRKDSNGHYEPNNCRWATHKEQMRNRSNTIFVQYRGRRMSLGEAAEISGVMYSKARHRIVNLKWTVDKALEV